MAACPKVTRGHWTVYVLKDPAGAIRYVGVTAGPIEKRLQRHLWEARTLRTHRAAWVRSLVARDQAPTIEAVETTEDWAEAETRWIATLRAQGVNLVNGNAGGHTMHQARERSETYPALKRSYRRLEVEARYFAKVGDQAHEAAMLETKALLQNTAALCRKQGTQQLRALDDALSRSSLGAP